MEDEYYVEKVKFKGKDEQLVKVEKRKFFLNKDD